MPRALIPITGRLTPVACTLAALALTVGGCAGGGGGGAASPGSVGGRYLLALGDADLPASPTAGSQDLVPAIPGARDALTVISLPVREPTTPFAQVEVPNSALAAPGCIAVTPGGEFAYVVESRGRTPDNMPRLVSSLPVGDSLTTVDLRNPLAPMVAATTYVGPNPKAVAVHPTQPLLAVVTSDPRSQLVVATLTGGIPDEPVVFPLIGLDDDAAMPSSVAWHPSGRALAVSLGDRGEVMFYRFKQDSDGMALAPWGRPVRVGDQPRAGTFSSNGRLFISLDGAVATGDGQPAGPGRITTIRVSADPAAETFAADHVVVDTVETGIAPVGMAMSNDGALIACASAQASITGGSTPQGGSVVLVSVDREGVLTRHAEYALGAVPAGITFDARGRFVCVSQYASLDPEASDGEVSFWSLRRGNPPTLEQQDFFVGIGAGPHGALIIR